MLAWDETGSAANIRTGNDRLSRMMSVRPAMRKPKPIGVRRHKLRYAETEGVQQGASRWETAVSSKSQLFG